MADRQCNLGTRGKFIFLFSMLCTTFLGSCARRMEYKGCWEGTTERVVLMDNLRKTTVNSVALRIGATGKVDYPLVADELVYLADHREQPLSPEYANKKIRIRGIALHPVVFEIGEHRVIGPDPANEWRHQWMIKADKNGINIIDSPRSPRSKTPFGNALVPATPLPPPASAASLNSQLAIEN